MKHLDLRVHGRVQGVFFRNTAKKEANRLGLVGFAKNEPDGTVKIEVEGDEESIDQFIDWTHEGSNAANVTNVEIEEGEVQDYDTFKTY